jgi:SAM-dependent methyltransferase
MASKQYSPLARLYGARSPASLYHALRKTVSSWYVSTHGSSEPYESIIEFYASGTEARASNLLGPLIETFRESPPRAILDIGCGYGSIPLLLAWLWPESTVIATDVTDRYFICGENARKTVGLKNLQFTELSAQNVNFESEFDLVVSCNMLNFLTSRSVLRDTLRGFARALRGSGNLIIHTPHFWSWREPFTKFPLLHYCPYRVQDTISRRSGKRSLLSDTRNPSFREIRNCLQNQGLQLTACSPVSSIARVRSTHFTAWFAKQTG